MQNPKALIFDVDGTLSDTERDGHRVAFNQAFEETGLNWRWDTGTYGKLLAVTGGKERVRYFIDQFKPAFDAPTELDGFILKLHQTKTRYFLALLKTGAIPFRPGVKRLLEEARSHGVRLAIATTTTPENVTTLLTATLGKDSINWFDIIAAGDVVARKKPAADIFLYALEHMGLRADECMAFEDSGHGLMSSCGAGIRTIVTVNGYTRDQDFSGAALVVDQLGEPDAPFSVLAGDAGGATCVDLGLIRRLFNR